jgi:outer membrane beta-barrel protein
MKQTSSKPIGRRAWLAPLIVGVTALLLCGAPARAEPAPDSLAQSEDDRDAGIAGPDSLAAPAAAVSTTDPTDATAPAITASPAIPGARSGVGTRKVRLTGSAHNVVRSGPGDRFAIVGIYKKQSIFAVVAKSGEWFNVRLSDTETGWIHSSLCEEFDDSGLEYRPNRKIYSRTGSFIFTGYTGAYAFDRKSNSLVIGGRLGYYIFDRVQADGSLAWTHVQRPAEIVETLFGLSLEAEDFHMLFYQLGLTWEVLPGRQMVPFVSGGVGSAIMQGETEPSFNVGAGTSLFLSKKSAMRWEVRNYVLRTGSQGARRTNNNVEFTLGTSVLF